MGRIVGIEPTFRDPQSRVLPLDDTRRVKVSGRRQACQISRAFRAGNRTRGNRLSGGALLLSYHRLLAAVLSLGRDPAALHYKRTPSPPNGGDDRIRTGDLLRDRQMR